MFVLSCSDEVDAFMVLCVEGDDDGSLLPEAKLDLFKFQDILEEDPDDGHHSDGSILFVSSSPPAFSPSPLGA